MVSPLLDVCNTLKSFPVCLFTLMLTVKAETFDSYSFIPVTYRENLPQ